MGRKAKRSKPSSKKSLADMFPVTESDPPVEPLKQSRRPGFRRKQPASFAAEFPVDENHPPTQQRLKIANRPGRRMSIRYGKPAKPSDG